MDDAVRATELCNLRRALFFAAVQIADLLKIISSRAEGRAQFAPVLDGGRKHNGFSWAAEMLEGLANPLLHHITNDADASSRSTFIGKLAKS